MGLTIHNASVYRSGAFVGEEFSFEFAQPGCKGTDVSFSDVSVFPAFCDVHVHFREPGFSYKETIRTGALAATHGGYTDVCTMPNLNPVPDCREAMELQLARIRESAVIRVHPYAAITVGERGERLADLEGLAPLCIAFSDDGKGVQRDELMREAMARARDLGKVIAAHCEDNRLLRSGYIHDGAYAKAHGHRGICAESEWGPIARDLKLAKETGCRYHVCHVSTAESVALIRRAKEDGVDVTCETAPHYLLLSENDLQEDGRFKMNPPLRREEDRQALLDGLRDGTIDMIATDHAPHSAAEKSRGLEGSLMGVVGLETAFPALYTGLVRTGILRLETLIDKMALAPRKRFGIPMTTDFCVYDLKKSYEIDPETFLSMGRSTPFAGTTVYGENLMTICGGKAVWQK